MRRITQLMLHWFWVVGLVFFTIVSLSGQKGQPILLKKGTEVNLRLVQSVNSSNVERGNIIQLEAEIDVIGSKGIPVIKTGSYAIGIIKAVRKKGILGRPGKLVIEAISVKAVDGSTVELLGRALIKKGNKKTGLALAVGFLSGVASGIISSQNKSPSFNYSIGVAGSAAGLFVSGTPAEAKVGAEALYAKVKEDYIILVQPF